jgi:hypothetical protein
VTYESTVLHDDCVALTRTKPEADRIPIYGTAPPHSTADLPHIIALLITLYTRAETKLKVRRFDTRTSAFVDQLKVRNSSRALTFCQMIDGRTHNSLKRGGPHSVRFVGHESRIKGCLIARPEKPYSGVIEVIVVFVYP